MSADTQGSRYLPPATEQNPACWVAMGRAGRSLHSDPECGALANASKTREKRARGLCRDEAHLRAVERDLGTRDLEEANRRTRMVWEWRQRRRSA